MTQEREALEPCPFCGGTNIDPQGWASTDRSGPACDDCGASAESVKSWNTRASAAPGEPCAVKPLEWRDHRPDSFPEPAWSAQTPFGFYNIEEVSASDSPAYVVRLHAHHFVADKDGLDEAKAAAQADYEQRIKSALVFEGRK